MAEPQPDLDPFRGEARDRDRRLDPPTEPRRDARRYDPSGRRTTGPDPFGYDRFGRPDDYGFIGPRPGDLRSPAPAGEVGGGERPEAPPPAAFAERGDPTSDDRDSREGPARRNVWRRARDELSAWLGDEGAAKRRREDEVSQRGRGPQGYVRSDHRVREDVCEELTADPILDPSDIEVSVSDCEVTLSGVVHRRADKRRAEDIAGSVRGVRRVQNDLRFKDPEEARRSGDEP